MRMEEKMSENINKNHKEECECDKPEIRDSFKSQNCSKEQIINCHGKDMLKKLEKEGKFDNN